MKTNRSLDHRSAMRPLLIVVSALWLTVALSLVNFTLFFVHQETRSAFLLLDVAGAEIYLLYVAVRLTRRYRAGMPLHQ